MPKVRPKGGTRLCPCAVDELVARIRGLRFRVRGNGGRVGAASLVAAVGLVDKLQEFDKHARFVDFGPWVIAVMIAGAGMSLFLMGAVMGLAFRHLYLPRIHLGIGLLTAFAYFLPTVWLSVDGSCCRLRCSSGGATRAGNPGLRAGSSGCCTSITAGSELQDWIREYVLTAWMSSSRPAPQPLQQAELSSVAGTAANRHGLASSLLDEQMAEMSRMYAQLKGSVIEDEWSALIRTSQRIHRMVGTDAERYSLLNHFRVAIAQRDQAVGFHQG